MSTYGKLFQILASKRKDVSPDMKVNMFPYLYSNKNHMERASGVFIEYMTTTTDSREAQKSMDTKACIFYKFNERHVTFDGQQPR